MLDELKHISPVILIDNLRKDFLKNFLRLYVRMYLLDAHFQGRISLLQVMYFYTVLYRTKILARRKKNSSLKNNKNSELEKKLLGKYRKSKRDEQLWLSQGIQKTKFIKCKQRMSCTLKGKRCNLEANSRFGGRVRFILWSNYQLFQFISL